MVAIYVVEPQEITCTGLLSVLRASGDNTICGHAADLQTGLRDMAAVQPDLLIVDMPILGDGGYELLQQLRGEFPELKILVWTACAEDRHILAALNAGIHAYLLKGSSVSLLLIAIASVAGGASWLDPLIARRAFGFSVSGRDSAKVVTPVGKKHNAFQLSEREREVIALVAEGLGNQAIAARLFVSVETVKTHVRHIMEKLQAASRTDAAVKAIRAGVCPEPVGDYPSYNAYYRHRKPVLV